MAPKQDYTRMLLDCRPRIHAQIDLPSKAELGSQKPGEVPRATLLAVEKLTVSYPGRGFLAPAIKAVDGVTFEVPKGSALGIVGESGSGKKSGQVVEEGAVPAIFEAPRHSYTKGLISAAMTLEQAPAPFPERLSVTQREVPMLTGALSL